MIQKKPSILITNCFYSNINRTVVIPDIECDVDRIVSYVSCYSSLLGTREEAGNLFTRFVDELQSTLPAR
jgi:hypothetical protein